jgi:glycosyltransferase involved in cell wall biosynthesis
MADSIVVQNPESKNRRLWVVSELYYPEETSTGYYMTRIAEGFVGQFTVKALCGQPNYSSRGTKAPKREVRRGVEIFRVAGTTLNKNVIIFRLVNMQTLSLSTFVKTIFNFREKDRILVVTNPPSMPFVIAIAALIRGAQYTLLIHDNYPEILLAAGKIRETSLLVTVLNYCNRWLFKHATKIIVVGRDMKVLLEQKTAGLDVSIDVIQNWAELDTVRPEARGENVLLAELGLAGKFVFLYAGNMGYPNDIETIVGAAKRLEVDPDIHFIFLGTGVKAPWLEREITVSGLTNITLLSPRPRSEQITFLNACDVALVSLVDKMLGVSMPSRTYNILAAGKPILALAEPDSELATVIDEDRVGWHIRPGNAEELVLAICRIYDARGELAGYSQRARRSALEKYSFEAAMSKYRSAMAS